MRISNLAPYSAAGWYFTLATSLEGYSGMYWTDDKGFGLWRFKEDKSVAIVQGKCQFDLVGGSQKERAVKARIKAHPYFRAISNSESFSYENYLFGRDCCE